MFTATYFAPRYFAARYFPERGTSAYEPLYFPHRYFGARYFADRYFPGPDLSTVVLEEPKYFVHTYFAQGYFSDRYFPGPDLVIVTPQPTPPDNQAVVGPLRGTRPRQRIHGAARIWLTPLELFGEGIYLPVSTGELYAALEPLALYGAGVHVPARVEGAGSSLAAPLGMAGQGYVTQPAPPTKPKRTRTRQDEEDDENELLDLMR